jgi:hypothetical protein
VTLSLSIRFIFPKTPFILGCKIKTAQDYQNEQFNINIHTTTTTTKKSHQNLLKNPRSFEIIWQNSKTYQVI